MATSSASCHAVRAGGIPANLAATSSIRPSSSRSAFSRAHFRLDHARLSSRTFSRPAGVSLYLLFLARDLSSATV